MINLYPYFLTTIIISGSVFSQYSFSDNICKRYPRLVSCVCDTTKKELSRASTIFFLFSEIATKAKVDFISLDMLKIQNIIAESSHLVSKGFNNSLKYKCYKQTSHCSNTLKKLSKITSDLSKAGNKMSELITAIVDYSIINKQAEQSIKTYKREISSSFKKNWQKENILKQIANNDIKELTLKKDEITSIVEDLEVLKLKARNFNKVKSDFIHYCIKKDNKKSLEKVINDEGLEVIEI